MLKWIRRAMWVTCVAAVVAPAAHAKKVFIDFGPQFVTSGNNWGTSSSESLEISLVGDASSPTAIALGFAIDTAAGTFDSLFINENGAITFGSALSAPFTPVSDLSALGVPLIAPYYADLQSTAANGDVFFVEDGEILFSYGVADPRPDGSGNYSEDDAVQAFHVTWAGPTVAGDPGEFRVVTDLVIYNLGGGDFAIQLGHGRDLTPDIPDLGGLTGFAFGSDVVSLSGARSGDAEDLYFEFRNVPEPALAALLAVASLALGVRARARR